jgi:hypothetical protein
MGCSCWCKCWEKPRIIMTSKVLYTPTCSQVSGIIAGIMKIVKLKGAEVEASVSSPEDSSVVHSAAKTTLLCLSLITQHFHPLYRAVSECFYYYLHEI